MKNILSLTIAALAIAFAVYAIFLYTPEGVAETPVATPQNVTLTGTYVCLPHADSTGPQTEECAFGFKTDDGLYYAVNFGQSGAAIDQFKSGAHVTSQGFIVLKETLNTNQRDKYTVKGIFTITSPATTSSAPQAKIDINAVCEGALAYMTFTDAAHAEAFIAECKAGKHPEVIEQYKATLGAGDGAAI